MSGAGSLEFGESSRNFSSQKRFEKPRVRLKLNVLNWLGGFKMFKSSTFRIFPYPACLTDTKLTQLLFPSSPVLGYQHSKLVSCRLSSTRDATEKKKKKRDRVGVELMLNKRRFWHHLCEFADSLIFAFVLFTWR